MKFNADQLALIRLALRLATHHYDQQARATSNLHLRAAYKRNAENFRDLVNVIYHRE